MKLAVAIIKEKKTTANIMHATEVIGRYNAWQQITRHKHVEIVRQRSMKQITTQNTAKREKKQREGREKRGKGTASYDKKKTDKKKTETDTNRKEKIT